MQSVRIWVERFFDHPQLVEFTVEVLARLPGEVRDDFLGDPCFIMNVYDPDRPGPVVLRLGRPSARQGARSVSLRQSLAVRSPDFVRYVIAHEFAHAFLRNVCRPPGEDVESAADALAAEWGFPRPAEPRDGGGPVWRLVRGGPAGRG